MQCKYCGGECKPNERKTPGSKMPDWICLQQNGTCVNEKGYPNGTWNPRTPAAPGTPVRQNLPATIKTAANFDVQLEKELYKQEQAILGAQKNRSNLAAAWIQSNRPIDDTAYRQLAMMEGFVLNGKVEVKPAQPNTPPLIDKIKSDPKYQDPKQVTLEQQKQAGDDVWGDLLK